MAHPDGFHKDEEARQRCWGCSHPEKLVPTTENEERARQLIADGFLSTSNKYHCVARVHVPQFDAAVTFAPDVPQWLRDDVRRAYELWVRHAARSGHPEVERLELSAGDYLAFRAAGGRSA